MTPSVGILITCGGEQVERAVRSALAQTPSAAAVVVLNEDPGELRTRHALARLEASGQQVVSAGGRAQATGRNAVIRSMTSHLIGVIGADDVLDPQWLARVATHFERYPDITFLREEVHGSTSAIEGRTGLDSAADGRAGPERIVFRRDMFDALGGFDEDLGPCAWGDFWLRASQNGFRGHLDDASCIASVSPYWFMDLHVERSECLELLYRKNASFFREHQEGLLIRSEQLRLAAQARRDQLVQQRASLLHDADRLRLEIGSLAEELRRGGQERVDLGDLRRTSPISPIWGLERGLPLDRYYIHAFLDRHRHDIRGRVLEIKDPGYTRWFGEDRVTRSDVLDIDSRNERATVIADLSRADSVPADTYDCFILTQTLGVIFDAASAIQHAFRILKPGGVLLCTLPAIGRISYEEGLDGDYWRFTEASVRRLFAGAFPLAAFDVTCHGNVLACAAFLYGLAPDELATSELELEDPYFPVVYTVRAVKPGQSARAPFSDA